MRVMIHGWVDAVCREADGSVAWEIHQPNVFTDRGRREWANSGIRTTNVFTSPGLEAASASRYTVLDDGAATSGQQAANVVPTVDTPTLTKTYATTFAAPAANRRIGCLGLGSWNASYGIYDILAYVLITPFKTQTTTQTLEISYRLTLTPIA